jgi:hypothetical protein
MKKVAVFDWDGTLAEEGTNELFPGALALLKRLLEHNVKVYILTARPSVDPTQQIFDKLKEQGVEIRREQVMWAGMEEYCQGGPARAKAIMINYLSQALNISVKDFYFTDDKADYVEAVKKENPGITTQVVPTACANPAIRARNQAIVEFFNEIEKIVLAAPTVKEKFSAFFASSKAAKGKTASAAVAAAAASPWVSAVAPEEVLPISISDQTGSLTEAQVQQLISAYETAKAKESKLSRTNPMTDKMIRILKNESEKYTPEQQYEAFREYMIMPENKKRTFYKEANKFIAAEELDNEGALTEAAASAGQLTATHSDCRAVLFQSAGEEAQPQQENGLSRSPSSESNFF